MIRLNRPPCPNPKALRTDYKNPHNKSALEAASYGKCMYCESRVTATYFGDVEHIKPKALFPQFEFDWDNLGFVCARCNNAKRDKWEDATPFLNPYEEDPSEHLCHVGAFVYEVNGSERGEYTWMQVDLNRPELAQARQERINNIRVLVGKLNRTKSAGLRNAIVEELEREVSAAAPYSASVQAAMAGLLGRMP